MEEKLARNTFRRKENIYFVNNKNVCEKLSSIARTEEALNFFSEKLNTIIDSLALFGILYICDEEMEIKELREFVTDHIFSMNLNDTVYCSDLRQIAFSRGILNHDLSHDEIINEQLENAVTLGILCRIQDGFKMIEEISIPF